MAFDSLFTEEYTEWGANLVSNMTDEIIRVAPTIFNEENRYLPASVTPLPGYIDFDVNPFMREIVDCFDVRSSVREVNVQKGVQITYTTALESILLYFMAQVRTAPCMFITADLELAKARMENNIIPMIQHSGFEHIIQSSDFTNKRKTGKTDKQVQWAGGGYLIPQGANNADKMRMFSILLMLKDEIDAWPDTVGKDGEPDKITDDRCAAYWEKRKIFRGSTPLISHNSKINRGYKRGDQRKYHVNCLKCGFSQFLRWNGVDKKTGLQYGIVWETENDILIKESVGYVCMDCGHHHSEADKTKLFSLEHGAKWVPTATPVEDGIRSYHLPALYSPVGMQPWYKSVIEWLDAYDVVNKRPKDNALLQVFYNNVLAEPFELNGDRLTFKTVSSLRRTVYRLGEIPNMYALDYCGAKIGFLTMAVDVHKDNLAVAVFGHTVGRRSFVIDYWRFKGRADDITDHDTWGKVRDLLENKIYTADDGRQYNITLTLIDAGYMFDQVIEFCSNYASGVYPIVGRGQPPKSARIQEFWDFTSKLGNVVWGVNVDKYKDRTSVNLRRYWDTESKQPLGCFNMPTDISDKAIKELTAETRRDKIDKLTDKVIGSEWHRTRDNELWDLLQYNTAACDMLAWDVCINQLELETIDWAGFWDLVDNKKLYYTEPE